jgi:3-isopropylmalate dehydrogenase
MILSSCMMLDHIGEKSIATKIRNSVAKVIENGKVMAYDMLKLRGTQEVLKQGAASTTEMTDEIIRNL